MSCNNVIPYIDNNCRKSIGGIKRIFAINANSIEYLHFDEVNLNMVNLVILKNDGYFSEIKYIKDSASLTTTFVGDTTTGSGEYTSELVFKIVEQEYNLIAGILQNTPIVFILQNYRNEYYIVGDTTPAYLTNSVHTSGSNLGEFNGEELTFTSTSDVPLHKCVVGEEMGIDNGLYISESMLDGVKQIWSDVEVDSGDVEALSDVVITGINSEYFEFEISKSSMFNEGVDIRVINDNNDLDYPQFIKGDTLITKEMITTIKNLANDNDEPITISKKVRQYLIVDADSSSVETNLVVIDVKNEQRLLNWDYSETSKYDVLVIDSIIDFTSDNDDYLTYIMDKAYQIKGLK